MPHSLPLLFLLACIADADTGGLHISSGQEDTQIAGLDEGTLFTLLSHPLRRQILKTLYQVQRLSFTHMSDWGVKTGTLYFHLKELKELVSQDDEKLYMLTKKGQQVCEWAFGEGSSRANVKTLSKIDAYSFLIRPFYQRLEQSILFKILILIIAVAGLVSAAILKTLILGPVILPSVSELGLVYNLLINISTVVIQVFIIQIIARLGKTEGNKLIWFVLLGNLIPYLFMITAFVLIFTPQLGILISIPLWAWYLLSTVSQIFCIAIISGSLILGASIPPERALLVSISVLYLITVISGYL
ncbi:MAG: DUF7347 domain-containing protein [Candidatus Kariarchaeaceae archaeon]